MPRLASLAIGSYYAFPDQHLPALASLFAPSESGGRLLDPCAGEGRALAHLADAWRLTPYANELDAGRAAQCRALFGARGVQGDLHHLRASHGAFSAVWCNPPYTAETTGRDDEDGAGKRRELSMLKHCWPWAEPGGYVLWAVYAHHVSLDAALFLARRSSAVDVWRLPGLHLGAYAQVVVVARVGRAATDPAHIAAQIIEQRSAGAWPELTMLLEPRYAFPRPAPCKSFVFAPEILTPDVVQAALETESAQAAAGFQALLDPPPPPEPVRPIVRPRGGQLALILAAGLFNGLVLDTPHGRAAVRSTVEAVEQLVDSRATGADGDESDEAQTERQVYQTRPVVTITLLTAGGTVIDASGDEAAVRFIQENRQALLAYIDREMEPLYQFDYSPLAPVLARSKGGRLYATQRHIVGACYAALQHQKSVIIAGEPGMGKTIVGATLAAALLPHMRPQDCVVLTAPPHLLDKWQREIEEAAPGVAWTRILRTVDDVRAFMDEAARLGAGRLKVGILSRESAKLGEGWALAVQWQKQYLRRRPRPGVAQEQENEQGDDQGDTPGEQPKRVEPAILTIRQALCPTCGHEIRRADDSVPSEAWLARVPRFCHACGGALWQKARTFSAPRPERGEKYPRRNPRTPLAEYIAKRFPGRVYLYIADELHELHQILSTDQGEAMMSLANAAQKVVGLTGTVYGGKASSLYGIEFAFSPSVRTRYPWGKGLNAWVRDMGALERVVEYKPEYDRSGKYSGKRRIEYAPREIPGCSPLLVREIVGNAVFVGLHDMGRAMPPYEEIPVPIEPDPQVAALYDEAKAKLLDYLRERRLEGDGSALGMYLQTLLSWPSAPWRAEPCIHRRRLGRESDEFIEVLVHTIPALDEDRLYPKEEWLIQTVRKELAQGRGVGIFVRQTGRRDIQPRIERILLEHVPGARPFVLRSSVEAARRESVLARQVEAGANVLVCQPKLVSTGLDLISYPTLLFLETEYSLYTLAQASRRAWRLIQNQPCRTYYPYYLGMMEQQAVELIGRKQLAAGLLYGENGGGLSVLSQGSGAGSLLAELAAAVEQDTSVTDLRALFAQHAQQVDVTESAWYAEAPPAPVVEAPVAGVAAPEAIEPAPATETPIPAPGWPVRQAQPAVVCGEAAPQPARQLSIFEGAESAESAASQNDPEAGPDAGVQLRLL
jgi:hypothetical protein